MNDNHEDRPVLPDGWVEFAFSDPDKDAVAEEVQRRHKLNKPVESGVDEERGPFDVIPLAMVLGGKTTPTPVYKTPMKHMVLDQSIPPRGWYKSKIEADRVRPRPCYTEALLTSPFLGYCPVGCSFCYINNGSRGYRATGLPTVDPDYPEKYHKQLKKMMVGGAGYMTSFSEAFHKLEDTYHVTERLTNVFLEEGLPIFYCTRRLPMEFAVDALQVSPYSYCQFSINTSVHDDYRKLSPGSAKLDEMFKMIERLHSLGVYISIQCNPIHPGITSLDELKELVRILASVGTDHIIFKFVEQVMNSRKIIVDRLASRHFNPAKVELFDKLFNQVIGGVYTIQQDVRIEWLEELLATTRANRMTMSTCYEYYENGKAGANLAPYFTTSDQCHGRGVPIHYRPALGEKFQPLPGCYRKGCLYCAEYGTRACRNEVLLQANALEYGDLCSIKLTGRESDWGMPESCQPPELEPDNANANPYYLTDAELWGWIPQYIPEHEIGRRVPALQQHSGSKDIIDRDAWESISQ